MKKSKLISKNTLNKNLIYKYCANFKNVVKTDLTKESIQVKTHIQKSTC